MSGMFHREFLIASWFTFASGAAFGGDFWSLAESPTPDFVPSTSVFVINAHPEFDFLHEGDAHREPVNRDVVADYPLTLSTELRPRGARLSPSDSSLIAKVMTFVGVSRDGDADEDTRSHGTQLGARLAFEEPPSGGRGSEAVLMVVSGEDRRSEGPFAIRRQGNEVVFPRLVTQTMMVSAEWNQYWEESSGPSSHRTLGGLRLLVSRVEWEEFDSPESWSITTDHPHLRSESVENRLLALQFGWEKRVQNPRYGYVFGLRSALGLADQVTAVEVATGDYWTVQVSPGIYGRRPIYSSSVSTVTNLGTLAECYFTGTCKLNERWSLDAGLYSLSMTFFDAPSDLFFEEDRVIRHIAGIHLGARYAF